MTAPNPEPTSAAEVPETVVIKTDGVASEPTPKPSSFLAGMTLWVAVLAGAAMLGCVLLWQKVDGMQEQLARQSAQAQSDATEARALAKQAVSLAQETAGRSAMQEARLGELSLQRSQIDELMRSLSRTRDENLVVDIEASLRMAQQQAQLTGSVEPLLAALKSADQRIARAAQPHLAMLQRAIGRDIDRVKTAAVSDTPAILARLDELVRLSDQLMPANVVPVAASRKETRKVPTTTLDTWWQTGLQLVIDEARNLVRVSRIDDPEAVLLSPEQTFFLRENFKLKLLDARLGLIGRQVDSARAELGLAELALKKYFDANARRTQTTLILLQQVQAQMRNLQLPRIDDTLAVLATATAGH